MISQKNYDIIKRKVPDASGMDFIKVGRQTDEQLYCKLNKGMHPALLKWPAFQPPPAITRVIRKH
jgi:hypothetical protein